MRPTHSNPAPPAPPAITVRGLAKTWPSGVTAVHPFDVDVHPGEVFGLLGPNGAGKSTTVGMLTTTVVPSAGAARIDGHDVATEPLAARASSAVVFQDAVVDRALTGRRNLELHARLWGVDPPAARRRIAERAAEFGLGAILDRPVGGYSGGERRRLELARALLSEPRVLFLDEPTVGLDPRIRYELLDLIAAMQARTTMTVLLTTHYLDEAERLCDRVAIMHAGRIVALDSPAALRATLGTAVLEVRVDAADLDPPVALDALRASGIAGEDAFVVGTTITIPLHAAAGDAVDAVDAVDAAAAVRRLRLPTRGIASRPPTLDDVYLRLTGARLAA